MGTPAVRENVKGGQRLCSGGIHLCRCGGSCYNMHLKILRDCTYSTVFSTNTTFWWALHAADGIWALDPVGPEKAAKPTRYSWFDGPVFWHLELRVCSVMGPWPSWLFDLEMCCVLRGSRGSRGARGSSIFQCFWILNILI